MTYTLFGFNNPSGAFFYELVKGSTVEIWGRNKPKDLDRGFVYCDLVLGPVNQVGELKGVLVSFAPVWLLSEYLMRVWNEQPERLKKLCGVIAVSSSSYMTKRFAFSDYDKILATKLNDAQTLLIHFCKSLDIGCQILAPTLIYGTKGTFRDQNISKIIKVMRLMPVIFVPKSTGMRQPIHASQLAKVVHKMAEEMLQDKECGRYPVILPLGGDETLSYGQMLARVQESLPIRDTGRRCKLITISDRIFLVFSSLLLPINTKLFEAVMRINSNLSGFTSACSILAEEPKSFPLLPFCD